MMKRKWIVTVLGVCMLCGNLPFMEPLEMRATSIAAAQAQANALHYFMQRADVKGSDTPYGNNLSVGHQVQADDAKIYYEVYGEGTPIFIFHGGGVGTPYELGQLIDKLRPKYQVVVVSTRGHGRSEIGHKPLTYEQKANDMLAVMTEITDKPAPIVGFSDGAYTAYKIASISPERVERIVAIGAGTLKPGYFTPNSLQVQDIEKADRIFMEQQKRLMPEPERLQEFWSSYMDFWSRMDVGATLFGSIQCPVLLLAGDEDDHAPIATMMEAHQMIPNSRLCIVPKAWHAAFLDNFPVTWAAMEPFLQAETPDLLPSKKVAYNGKI